WQGHGPQATAQPCGAPGAAPPRCQLGEDDLPPVVPVAVQSAWFAAQKVEFHDISSDGEEQETHQPPETDDVQYPAGLHYVQRVAELEAQSDELKLRLEELHASESALRRESQEKNDLITVLLQKAKLPNSETGFDVVTSKSGGGHRYSVGGHRSWEEYS
ncbi:Uncharacterized protein SCF082_LOCUS11351, partial [Durusdinium trenchii]